MKESYQGYFFRLSLSELFRVGLWSDFVQRRNASYHYCADEPIWFMRHHFIFKLDEALSEHRPPFPRQIITLIL